MVSWSTYFWYINLTGWILWHNLVSHEFFITIALFTTSRYFITWWNTLWIILLTFIITFNVWHHKLFCVSVKFECVFASFTGKFLLRRGPNCFLWSSYFGAQSPWFITWLGRTGRLSHIFGRESTVDCRVSL